MARITFASHLLYLMSWDLYQFNIHSGKLTWQWQMDPFKMYIFPIESGDIPASYVSLPAYLRVPLVCLLHFHWEELPRPRFCAVHPPSRGRTVKLRHLELQGFRMSVQRSGEKYRDPPGISLRILGGIWLVTVAGRYTQCVTKITEVVVVSPGKWGKSQWAPIPSMGLVYLLTFTIKVNQM